jgi:hypothetical protein
MKPFTGQKYKCLRGGLIYVTGTCFSSVPTRIEMGGALCGEFASGFSQSAEGPWSWEPAVLVAIHLIQS